MSAAGITWTADDVETWGQAEAMNAAADYGKVVVLNSTAGRVEFGDAATEVAHGVIATVAVSSTTGADVGIVPIASGKIASVYVNANSANIAVGDRVGVGTVDGKCIKTTTDGHHVVGKALEAATADDVRIQVALGYNQAAS